MTDKSRVAVVGGGMGRNHIAAFQSLPDQFEVRAVCDIDEKRARELAETYAIPNITTNIADLYQRDDIDLIDICTPSYLHYAQTLEALAAGKYVICKNLLRVHLNKLMG